MTNPEEFRVSGFEFRAEAYPSVGRHGDLVMTNQESSQSPVKADPELASSSTMEAVHSPKR
jgi:hypothetical protein